MTGMEMASRLAAAGEDAAAGAAEQAARRLAAAAAAALAGTGTSVEAAADGSVRLRGPGLVARAFGSRRRAADPRLQGLMATLARGGDL